MSSHAGAPDLTRRCGRWCGGRRWRWDGSGRAGGTPVVATRGAAMSERLSTIDDGIAEIERLLSASTPERWEWAKYESDSLQAAQELLAKSAAHAPESHTLWGVTSLDNAGQERVVAFTGNGPTSEENARFLANAPDAIRWLIAQLREVPR